MGATKLYWTMLKRNPDIKLSERSCATLIKVARPLAVKRRARIQRELKLERARRARRGPKVLKRWSKFTTAKCLSNLVEKSKQFRYKRRTATYVCSSVVYELAVPLFDLEHRQRREALLRQKRTNKLLVLKRLARAIQLWTPRPFLFRQPSSICLFERESFSCQMYFDELQDAKERAAVRAAKRAARKSKPRKLSKAKLRRNGRNVDDLLTDLLHATRPGVPVKESLKEWSSLKKYDAGDLQVVPYSKPGTIPQPVASKVELPRPICCWPTPAHGDSHLESPDYVTVLQATTEVSRPQSRAPAQDTEDLSAKNSCKTRRRRRRPRRGARPPPGTFKGQ